MENILLTAWTLWSCHWCWHRCLFFSADDATPCHPCPLSPQVTLLLRLVATGIGRTLPKGGRSSHSFHLNLDGPLNCNSWSDSGQLSDPQPLSCTSLNYHNKSFGLYEIAQRAQSQPTWFGPNIWELVLVQKASASWWHDFPQASVPPALQPPPHHLWSLQNLGRGHPKQ